MVDAGGEPYNLGSNVAWWHATTSPEHGDVWAKGKPYPGGQPAFAWRWAVIGSNSSALRQHAYSVFTASRREHQGRGDVPESVLRPGQPVPDGSRSTRTPAFLAEPKPLAAGRSAGSASEDIVRSIMPGPSPASTARAPFVGPAQPQPTAEPTQDEIRRRAYELFEARGGQPGDPVADWLQAERDLRRERGLA